MMRLEQGYLLLCADFGTDLRPLTLSQLSELRRRVRAAEKPQDAKRELTVEDLTALGYPETAARQIVSRLGLEAELAAYLDAASFHDIDALTLASPGYPERLRQRLGSDAPPVLFCRGDLSLLSQPAVCLVGSRRLEALGRAFSERVGRLAAREGYVLVSGNAPGADQTAQEACLEAGGSVISVLADSLADHIPARRQLLLCENGWHLPFSSGRALRRNRLIYALAEKRFVAQTGFQTGGSWHGAMDALRLGMHVYVLADGSEGAAALALHGAEPLPFDSLQELSTLRPGQMTFFKENPENTAKTH